MPRKAPRPHYRKAGNDLAEAAAYLAGAALATLQYAEYRRITALYSEARDLSQHCLRLAEVPTDSTPTPRTP